MRVGGTVPRGSLCSGKFLNRIYAVGGGVRWYSSESSTKVAAVGKAAVVDYNERRRP